MNSAQQGGNRPFKSWLYAIATNLARDHFKSSATRLSTPLASEYEVWILDGVPGPEEYALRGEQRSALIDALNLLGMEYRTTLWLRFYCNLSLQEIAQFQQFLLTSENMMPGIAHEVRKALISVRSLHQDRLNINGHAHRFEW